MAKVVARGVEIGADDDGDVFIALAHSGCACCATVGFFEPDHADALADELRRAAAIGRMKKRATVGAEGRA